jgi:hypothetical protein
MAKEPTSRSGDINAATLQPNENLIKLRSDLKNQHDLRKEMAENPQAVLNRYGLTVAVPEGTLSRLRLGGGITISGGEIGVHGDVHADGHLDIDPHIDQNPHVDLG